MNMDKIIELTKNPRELRFKEIETILYNYGYMLINSKGSHFRFKKEHFLPITIVVHNNKVKKWYVKDMCKILLAQLIP